MMRLFSQGSDTFEHGGSHPDGSKQVPSSVHRSKNLTAPTSEPRQSRPPAELHGCRCSWHRRRLSEPSSAVTTWRSWYHEHHMAAVAPRRPYGNGGATSTIWRRWHHEHHMVPMAVPDRPSREAAKNTQTAKHPAATRKRPSRAPNGDRDPHELHMGTMIFMSSKWGP